MMDGLSRDLDLTAPSALLPCEVRGLCFDASGEELVRGVDLTLGGAGVTVILGPNGAGKSLLLRLLHGLIEPGAGSITWAGERQTAAVTARQALVFQRPVLLRRSVAANLDFVLKLKGRADPARRAELLDLVGLTGLEDRPARKLSGGEQQRLALARALATDPAVLFMDEPTASLDPASTKRIEEIVACVRNKGTKVIFVTHDLGQAKRLADDVVFMHAGRVAEHTPAAAFFERPASAQARAFLAGEIVL